MLKIVQVNIWIILSSLLLLPVSLQAQERQQVSIEEVWQNYTFSSKSFGYVNWMNDGRFFSASEGRSINKIELATGKSVETLLPQATVPFSSYELNASEDKILLLSGRESIYRRSFKADYYLYDRNTQQTAAISKNGKQSYVTLSPDGKKAAFVRDNNLFVVSLEATGFVEKQITQDGKINEIINGSTDWVYEEEFGFAQAFFWSPDSKKIAFYRFDERRVAEYNMQLWEGLYPQDYRFKYPKAGEANALVQILVYDLGSNKTTAMHIGEEQDQYIPRVTWTKNAELLSIRRLNRLQNKLEILHAEVATGRSRVVYTEESKAYVDVEFAEELIYLDNGREMLLASERDGFKHLYLYDLNGKQLRQITKGNWEVRGVEGIDQKKGLVYFSSSAVSSTESHLFVVSIKGGTPRRLTQERGWHRINMSPDCSYFIDTYSNAATPPFTKLCRSQEGALVKVLEDNQALREKLQNYQISPKEFVTIALPENVQLNAWLIKPLNFDASKKYPLIMFVYGGPGSQQVKEEWNSSDFFWYQHLAAQGFMIACVDNRGTGGRGAAFRQATYAQLGKIETEDQIAAARYFGTQPYVDAARIGIWGWSYGGYMSSLCILKGAEVFKAAVAVAPVTSWRFYDTIYTERYLQRPQDNAQGYDANSPLQHADKLKGKYLLIHGTGDDNVHFQNAVAFQNALIKAGKQFESFYYPNRNHGIAGGNTRLHLYRLMTDFWKRNL